MRPSAKEMMFTPGSKTAQWVRDSLDESTVIGQVGPRECAGAAEHDKRWNRVAWIDNRAKILELDRDAGHGFIPKRSQGSAGSGTAG